MASCGLPPMAWVTNFSETQRQHTARVFVHRPASGRIRSASHRRLLASVSWFTPLTEALMVVVGSPYLEIVSWPTSTVYSKWSTLSGKAAIKIMDHRIGDAVAFAGSLVHKAAQRHTLGRALGIAGGFLLDR